MQDTQQTSSQPDTADDHTTHPHTLPAAQAARQPAPMPGKWAVFAVVAIGVFMATLDSSIVNISLPAIAATFIAD